MTLSFGFCRLMHESIRACSNRIAAECPRTSVHYQESALQESWYANGRVVLRSSGSGSIVISSTDVTETQNGIETESVLVLADPLLVCCAFQSQGRGSTDADGV